MNFNSSNGNVNTSLSNIKAVDFGMGLITINHAKEYTKDPMTEQDLGANGYLVFGSNRQGEHAGGAAYFAHRVLGAEWGVGEGITGRTYALPTLDFGRSSRVGRQDPKSTLLTQAELIEHFKNFEKVARENPDKKFYLTKVGLGIAGYSLEEIHSAFWNTELMTLDNVIYPIEFELPDVATQG